VLRAGCAWRLLPKDFPPRSTVYGWLLRFRREGLFETVYHHLVMRDRERAGREAGPSAAVIDSQSVKTVEAGGPRGYDGAKRIKGRKRHAMVDTDGRTLVIQAHAADLQDRDEAIPLLKASRGSFPFVELAFANTSMTTSRPASPSRVPARPSARDPQRNVGTDIFIPVTNLLERLFGEERRRTKVIPHAFGERAVLKLMYAALIRAAERWRGIRTTEFEQRQLKAIRDELDRNHAERTAPAVRSNVTAPQSRLSSKDRT
jgi:hypothetical protein